jgi:hypothetical protein
MNLRTVYGFSDFFPVWIPMNTMFLKLFQEHYELHVLFTANNDFKHSHTRDIKAQSFKTHTSAIRGGVRNTRGPRADHDRAGPEYRYLDRYATANNDCVQTRSTFATWHTNLVFSLFIKFFSCLWTTVSFNWNNALAKHGTKTSKYYTTEFDLEEGFLNAACISISNLPENIAWQTHKDDLRPEARGRGRSPHLPPPNASPAWEYRKSDWIRVAPNNVENFIIFYRKGKA